MPNKFNRFSLKKIPIERWGHNGQIERYERNEIKIRGEKSTWPKRKIVLIESADHRWSWTHWISIKIGFYLKLIKNAR